MDQAGFSPGGRLIGLVPFCEGLGDEVGEVFGGGGGGEGFCGLGHGLALLGIGQEGGQVIGELFGGGAVLGQKEGSTLVREMLGVVGLVVVRSIGEGNQEGGQTEDGQLGQGGGPGAAYNEIGLQIGSGHVFEERLDLNEGGQFGVLGVPGQGGGTVGLAGLVKDAKVVRQGGERRVQAGKLGQGRDQKGIDGLGPQ